MLETIKFVIVDFTLKTDAPVHYGSIKDGEIAQNSKGAHIILGSGIAGAIRAYLNEIIDEKEMTEFWGTSFGEDLVEDGAKDRKESEIYITDGFFGSEGETKNKESDKKERTRINRKYGCSEKNHKFETEFVEKGMEFRFRIEGMLCTKEKLEKIKRQISLIELGFKRGDILLGAEKNNGFGRFSVEKIEGKVFDLDSSDALDNFIAEEMQADKLVIEKADEAHVKIKRKIVIQIDGVFNYGLYQHYELNSEKNNKVTGVQNNELFAFGIKGVFRSEFELLLNKMFNNNAKDKVDMEKRIEEVFGGKNLMGKIRFFNMKIEGENEGDKPSSSEWKYNKIDRLTGGVISGSLKTQREIQGKGRIKVELSKNINEFLVFPLLYILSKVAKGEVPLGGRTSIGLGEFHSDMIEIDGVEFSLNDISKKAEIKEYYKKFESWCKNGE